MIAGPGVSGSTTVRSDGGEDDWNHKCGECGNVSAKVYDLPYGLCLNHNCAKYNLRFVARTYLARLLDQLTLQNNSTDRHCLPPLYDRSHTYLPTRWDSDSGLKNPPLPLVQLSVAGRTQGEIFGERGCVVDVGWRRNARNGPGGSARRAM